MIPQSDRGIPRFSILRGGTILMVVLFLVSHSYSKGFEKSIQGSYFLGGNFNDSYDVGGGFQVHLKNGNSLFGIESHGFSEFGAKIDEQTISGHMLSYGRGFSEDGLFLNATIGAGVQRKYSKINISEIGSPVQYESSTRFGGMLQLKCYTGVKYKYVGLGAWAAAAHGTLDTFVAMGLLVFIEVPLDDDDDDK